MSDANKQLYQEMTRLVQSGQAATAVPMLRAWLDKNPGDEIGLSILGSALMRLEKTDEALDAFIDAVDAHPDSFAAHGDLGFARMKSGQDQAAIDAFANAVSLNVNFYQGWCFLGKLLFDTGDVEKAKNAFKRSTNCDPFQNEYKSIRAAMNTARFAEAERVSRDILTRQPGNPMAAFTLAHLASKVGAFEEADKILGEAITFFPCDNNLRSGLLNSLEELGDYPRAVAQAKAIAELYPDDYLSWLGVGRVHGHCGQYAESLEAYDRALQCKPIGKEQLGNLQLLRGHILKILGRYDESVEAYRSSIETSQGNGAGWWGLADMKTHKFTDSDMLTMERLANSDTVKPAQRTQAAFALGKAHEDAASFPEAFTWYRKGNELRPDANFDPDYFRKHIDQVIETFNPDFMQYQAQPLPSGPTPIFIVGLPRSGSTLIEQILASHSKIEGTMELVNIPNLIRRITIEGGRRKQPYPASLAGFSPEELAGYGQAYIDETAIYRTEAPYFIDKLPPNFDKVGLLHMILPQAIIIDARRHPMDCGFSCFKQHFAGGHLFSYSLDHIGQYYNGYLKLMDHWDTALPGKVLCVQYENVVENTEDNIRAMLDHCGLPFEDTCLQFFDNKRPVRTASSEQVRQPIYKKAVAHWKNFETELAPLAESLGENTVARFRALD